MKLKTLAITGAIALAIGMIPFTAFSGNDSAKGEGRGERYAEGRPGPGHEGKRPPFGGPEQERMMKDLIPFWTNETIVTKLSLDEQQIDLLQESLDAAKETLDAERDSLKAAMDNLRDAMEQDSPDLDAVYAAMDEVSLHKTTIAKAAAAHRVTVKNILTAEQEDLLKEQRRELIKGQIRERLEDRFGGHRMPPPPPGGDDFDGPPPPPPPPPHDFGPRRGGDDQKPKGRSEGRPERSERRERRERSSEPSESLPAIPN